MRLSFLFLLISNLVFGHTNRLVSQKYGNIDLVSSTYYYTEDINTNLMIGQYAEMLCKKMSYSGEIFIYLLQDPTQEFRIWRKNIEANDESLDLNIFISSPSKDILKSLNLIENAILYRDNLKNLTADFPGWYSSTTEMIYAKEIMQHKLQRPDVVAELTKPKFFTYYFLNGEYHIIAIGNNCDSKEIGVFKNLFQLNEPKPYVLCLFTEPDHIVVYEAECKYNFTKKKYFMSSKTTNLKIERTTDKYFRPYRIRNLGKNNITFESYWGDITLLYSLSEKIFIQDLDEKISN